MAQRQIAHGGPGGGYTVVDGGIVLTVGVSFESAHEIDHHGSHLCVANEDHVSPSRQQHMLGEVAHACCAAGVGDSAPNA